MEFLKKRGHILVLEKKSSKTGEFKLMVKRDLVDGVVKVK